MNIAVLASGGGSNLRAILNAIQKGTIPGNITLVVSNNSTAGALEIARAHNIPAHHCSQLRYPSEEAFADALARLFDQHGVTLIALAGYMKKIPSVVIQRYRNRILNVHPALLPAYGGKGMYGIRVHQAVIASGEKVSGATVHIVDEEYDRGPIVMQKRIDVHPDDTPESLAKRVLAVEHEIYPMAIKAFVEGRVKIEGRKATVQS